MYHALLDLGDVLINVDNAGHMQALQKLMPAYTAERIDSVINRSKEGTALRHQLDLGEISFAEYQRGFEQMFNVATDPEVFQTVYTDRLAMNTPVVDLFKTLAGNNMLKDIVIVSNTDPVSLARALELLVSTGLRIDHVIPSCAVGARKPDPAMFQAGLEASGARPEECIFVDDKIANVQAAEKLGITGIHYRAGDPYAEQFLVYELRKLGIG